MISPFPPMAPPPRPVQAGLYLVATPIGNLRDITLRALDVLTAADLVLAEDTRVTGKLLSAYGLKARLERCDDHASERAAEGAVERVREGQVVALVSDAGTPAGLRPRLRGGPGHDRRGPAGASDPRRRPACWRRCAVAGLPTDRLLFAGFLPPKSGARRTVLEELRPSAPTLVFFESGPRLADSLADMAAVLGPRPAAVARELTKLYEECVRGALVRAGRRSAAATRPRARSSWSIGPGRGRDGHRGRRRRRPGRRPDAPAGPPRPPPRWPRRWTCRAAALPPRPGAAGQVTPA